MRRLTQAIIRRPLATLLSFVALVGLSAIGGLQVFPAMQSAGYSDPNSDSSRVVTVLKEDFGDHPPELAIIVDFNRSADDPKSEATTTTIVEKLSKLDGIDQVATY